MKVIEAIKENRKTIIISLVMGITIFYLQPVLTFIGTQIVNLLVSLSNRFSNYLYQLMAQNDPNLISDYVATLLVMIIVFAGFQILLGPWESLKDVEKKVLECERQMKGIKDGLPKEEKNAGSESNLAILKMKIRKGKALAKMLIVIGILFFFVFSFKQSVYSMVNSRNVLFQNKLIVLSVHLTDNEIKQLRVKWVKMKSADDYRQIRNALDDYYKKYNLSD